MLHLIKEKNFLRLCFATFFMSSCLQLLWVSLPFVVKAMGSNDTGVGLCFTGQMGIYAVFCILLGTIIDKFRPKRVLVIAAAGQSLITVGLLAVVRFGNLPGIPLSPIVQTVFLMSLVGILTSFFWPTIMGWVSTGHEGAELTKRFGFYNATWSSANMLLPIVGGYLMEINYQIPLALAVVCAVGCFTAASAAKCPSENPRPKENNLAQNGIEELPHQRQFLWMSRVALLMTFLCVGVFKSQLGVLYKFELGFSESVYGWSVSLMCLCNIAVFWLMGKSHYWHYKKALFALAHILIICSMLVIVFADGLSFQLLAASLAGICYCFVYSSHQYYGVTGGTKRSGLMAIHETLLGAGFATGSLLGGVISDAFGRRAPYLFGCAVIIVSGLVQIILWFALKDTD